MQPFFSIVTPTLQRESLIRTCDSIDSQTLKSFEHIIQVDCEEYNPDLFGRIQRSKRRKIEKCATPHRNFGNTCRHHAWDRTSGRWLIHLDDDNYLSDPKMLNDIAVALQSTECDYAAFPILRFGGVFFDGNPRSCHADTANMVVRREYAQWPNINDYTADGFWIDALRAQPELMFTSFPEFRPIIQMPSSGLGQ